MHVHMHVLCVHVRSHTQWNLYNPAPIGMGNEKGSWISRLIVGLVECMRVWSVLESVRWFRYSAAWFIEVLD